ncbi:MAG: GNAT family N-acetyltransferase, partial [Oscillospiraceae bacterium]|nr:GNAT family N-acetyltransferase [Oscillospiraceae bacterium]
MKIRIAELQDLERLTQIESLCFPIEEAADSDKIKSRIEAFPNHFFVLISDENQIAGFINGLVYHSPVLIDEMFEQADLHDENGSYQMILSLAVAPEFQGKGYGKALLHHFLESAKKQHRKGVTLTCKKELIPFYTKAEFCNQGRSASVHGGFEWYE